jgi:hypothetical protein
MGGGVHKSGTYGLNVQNKFPPKADTKLYDIITVDLMLSFIDDINGQQGRSSIFIYHVCQIKGCNSTKESVLKSKIELDQHFMVSENIR